VEGGRIDEWFKHLRSAMERIDAEHSLTPLYKAFQSIGRDWIGEAMERKGRIADAVAEYQKSKAAITSARASGANDLRTQVYYCASTQRLAAAMLKLGGPAEARKQYEECRGLLEPLLQANPDNEEVLYALAETYAGEGDISVRLAKEAKDNSTRTAAWNSAAERRPESGQDQHQHHGSPDSCGGLQDAGRMQGASVNQGGNGELANKNGHVSNLQIACTVLSYATFFSRNLENRICVFVICDVAEECFEISNFSTGTRTSFSSYVRL
jgi:tetratricopeptide (TPR) repeat protein